MNLKPTFNQHIPLDRVEEDIIQLLLKRQAELNGLLELTKAINRDVSISTLFKMARFILTQHIKVGSALFLIREGENLQSIFSYGLKSTEQKAVESVQSSLLKYNKITYLKSLAQDAFRRFDYFVPVINKNVTAVYVLIADFNPTVTTLQNDLNFVQTLVNLIAVALDNKKMLEERIQKERLQRDLELARQVQERLIPSDLKQIEGVSYASHYVPHFAVSGDYFDLIECGADELIWCIADVSGKGVSAAFLMVNIQACFRAWVTAGMSLIEMVEKFNQTVYDYTHGERFLTFFIARYHKKTRKLAYINAGHHAPLVIETGKVRYLTEGTTLIGVFEQLPFLTVGELTLTANALIFNYTDGLIERESGQVIHEYDLATCLLNLSPDEEVEQVNNKVLLYVKQLIDDEPTDDVTLFSLRLT